MFILQRKQSAAEVTTALYVTMEILSNWGNALQVGLTELQFFCLRNKKLYVSPHDLDIRNADYPGNLAALVNGKAKVSHSPPSSSSHRFPIVSLMCLISFLFHCPPLISAFCFRGHHSESPSHLFSPQLTSCPLHISSLSSSSRCPTWHFPPHVHTISVLTSKTSKMCFDVFIIYYKKKVLLDAHIFTAEAL